ncbi:hypothetical protein MRX96_043544 [Rhipicephalus microplus]
MIESASKTPESETEKWKPAQENPIIRTPARVLEEKLRREDKRDGMQGGVALRRAKEKSRQIAAAANDD